MQVLEIIAARGIPVSSASSAAPYIREYLERNTIVGYVGLMNDMVDARVEMFASVTESRLTYSYLVAGVIESGGLLDQNSLTEAHMKASTLLEEMPWLDYEVETESSMESTTLSSSAPVKINKLDVSRIIYEELRVKLPFPRLAILDRFVEEASLSKAGALSYFYKFVKEYGDVVPKTIVVKKHVEKKEKVERAPSKQQLAVELMKANMHLIDDKEGFVGLLLRELKMTQSGATTYYYNTRRTVNNS